MMAKSNIKVQGVTVALQDREELVKMIDGMLVESAGKYREAKNKTVKNNERVGIEFFGSILHYLKGGAAILLVVVCLSACKKDKLLKLPRVPDIVRPDTVIVILPNIVEQPK